MFDEDDNNVFPSAYLITVRCYGTWLHGDEHGSVDRHGFNQYGADRRNSNPKLEAAMRQNMRHAVILLNESQREIVKTAIVEVCRYCGYELIAVNVRTNHFHAVISAQSKPEPIADDFKRYSTRALRQAKLVDAETTLWTRGRSRRYLWKSRHVELAVDYVLFGQGDEIPEYD